MRGVLADSLKFRAVWAWFLSNKFIAFVFCFHMKLNTWIISQPFAFSRMSQTTSFINSLKFRAVWAWLLSNNFIAFVFWFHIKLKTWIISQPFAFSRLVGWLVGLLLLTTQFSKFAIRDYSIIHLSPSLIRVQLHKKMH